MDSARLLVCLTILASGMGSGVASAQSPRNLLQRVPGAAPVEDQPMRSAAAPPFALQLANRDLSAVGTGAEGALRLAAPGIPVVFELRSERRDGIDLYRLRPTAETARRGEQVKFTWTFPESYNESMTLDAGALQGQPLFLPDGKVPDNQFTNWGSLFYDRQANVVVGVELDGAETSRHARRGHSRFTRTSTLQLMTITGHPDFEIILFAYRPKDTDFWWAEWYQHRSRTDPDLPANLFPILSARNLSWRPGERQIVALIPDPGDAGRQMELVVIDEIRRELVAREAFQYELPVTHVPVLVGAWRSGLYRLIVAAPGERVDPATADPDRKLTNVIVRATAAQAPVLFLAPTDMWWAYATNGGHDYHGWRTGYDGSIGYAPTVMSSRSRRLNHYFFSLYERYNDVEHFRHLAELAQSEGFAVEYATQHDVALGLVRLEDYRLVLIGNHCEFTTRESFRRFTEYLGRGGGVLIHGGDSFAVLVEYLPGLERPRYLWQRGHLWAHLGDQPSTFRPPVLLAPDAPPAAPATDPDPGDAADYLNPFHTTVGYWIPGSKAVIANTVHPIMSGLGVTLGDEVPGPWGGEVDILYAPHAWEILVRSDRAAPEDREFGIDAYDPTPFHRVGLAVHRNLRLGVVSGENFPNILADRRNTLFRELYRRTVRHLLDGSRTTGTNLAPAARTTPTLIAWDTPVRIDLLRYALPEFIDFADPDWHRKPAPFAHYVVEGSLDGQTWFRLADRRHAPWRGVQTDAFEPVQLRFVRFDGTFSHGKPFGVRDIQAFLSNESTRRAGF